MVSVDVERHVYIQIRWHGYICSRCECTGGPVSIKQLKLIVAYKAHDMCTSILAVVLVTCTRGPVSISQLKLLHTD